MSNDDYKVGYKKPPRNTRFKKGISGNPNGRPKKQNDKDFWDVFLEVTSQPVPVRQNGKKKYMEKREAVITALSNKALSGNIQAIRILMQFFEKSQPVQQSIQTPAMIIRPPYGPAEPMPPIYGEEESKD